MEPTELPTGMTAEDYLAWEAQQIERYEFMDGEVIERNAPPVMMRAERQQNMVNGNVYIALRRHLANTPCNVYMIVRKIVAHDRDEPFSSDIVVTGRQPDDEGRYFRHEPILTVDVLTAEHANNMERKFKHHQGIHSLREIAFVDLDERGATVYRKGGDGLWVLHRFDAGMDVRFDSVDLTISSAMLFADMDDDTPSAAA
jgi:hypothetical protein